MKKDDLDNDILKSTAICIEEVRPGQIGEIITFDEDHLIMISDLDKVIREICDGEEIVFGCKEDVRERRASKTVSGKYLTFACCAHQSYYQHIRQTFPNHGLSPYVEIYFDRVIKLSYQMQIQDSDWELMSSGKNANFEFLNALVKAIRFEVKGERFRKSRDSFRRRAAKNQRSLRLYANRLFEVYSRILVLRVDFGYRHDAYTGENSCLQLRIAVERVVTDRQKLMEEVKKKYKNSLVGYVWKLEYGLRKGFHYHFVLMFDGSKVREDITIAKYIGEFWRVCVTERDGVYFNCNASLSRYRKCGIGMVSHFDRLKRDGLDIAMKYFTKPDFYIQAKLPGGSRTLGKGIMPDVSNQRRGAPRRRISVD